MSFTFPLLVPLSLSPLPNPIAPISLLSPPLLRTLQNSPDPSPIPLSHLLSSVRRRRSPIAMSSSDVRSSSTYEITELHAEADFEKLLSPDGRISICGFGSLLSERSARSSFPELTDFRVARLNGFQRVFAHVAPIFFERGIAKPETKEISSLSVEPCEGESLIVTVFQIQKSDIPAFLERELEFRFLAVLPETLDGKPFDNPSVICARYSDEKFFRIRCKGNKDVYFQLYGRYGIDKIWRDDILPCRAYLRHWLLNQHPEPFQHLTVESLSPYPVCRAKVLSINGTYGSALAAKNLSDEAYNNFLDHTFLGDRTTTIRQYLATTGSGIMEEEPPESLKTRYGG
ncbi:hypothetical protein L484_005238 [Morus notabilis]|uniref:Uncharacterized protein n=1 Tax=Morus notabilis TaxID=981085 RepID=W9SRT4_9ROSA|nr:hypothetical protein L484_005238 [Morus notabilis]